MLPWLEIIASGLKFKACARLEWHVFFPALNWHRWPTKRLLQTWLSNLEGARCIRPWKDETHVLACEEILAISWLCVCLFHCFMNYQAMTADSGPGGAYLNFSHILLRKRQIPLHAGCFIIDPAKTFFQLCSSGVLKQFTSEFVPCRCRTAVQINSWILSSAVSVQFHNLGSMGSAGTTFDVSDPFQSQFVIIGWGSTVHRIP